VRLAGPPFHDPFALAPAAGYPLQPEAPGPGHGKAAAIIVPVALVAVLTAAGVLFLLGVVRFGNPSLKDISMASGVSRANRPVSSTTRFSVDDDAIYCCATARAFAGTRLRARWFRQGDQIAEFNGTFRSMGGSQTAKFLPATGHVAFKLARPEEGWTSGSYSVTLAVDGRTAGSRTFTVVDAPEGAAGTRYNAPGGAFSILVPAGWLPAEAASLGGALAGFISPAGPYPPRYAVTLTDFTSVDIGYLNGILKQSGAKADELFAPYSVGDLVGARRTFEWDYKAGQEQFRLKTIQVVLQSDAKIYGIDCHSLAIDYQSNEPIFNTVINSFR